MTVKDIMTLLESPDRVRVIKDGEDQLGTRTKVKVVKNKMAPPFREAIFDIIYGTGISRTSELIDMGVEAGIVDKSGAWFAYGKEKLGQGKENVKIFMKEHPEITDEVEKIIRDTLAAEPEKFDDVMDEELMESDAVAAAVPESDEEE